MRFHWKKKWIKKIKWKGKRNVKERQLCVCLCKKNEKLLRIGCILKTERKKEILLAWFVVSILQSFDYSISMSISNCYASNQSNQLIYSKIAQFDQWVLTVD